MLVEINPDEQLEVSPVLGMQLVSEDTIRVAGYIKREDSKSMIRGHRPHVKDLFYTTFYLTSYDEYDDTSDSAEIHVEFNLSLKKPF